MTATQLISFFWPRKVVRASLNVSMWHSSGSTIMLWSYENIFLCTKKTKIMTLFNNFFSSVLRSWENHDACMCIANKAQRIWVLCQNAGSCVSSITNMASWYSRERSSTDTEEKKFVNKVVIFVFFIYSRSFIHYDWTTDVTWTI